MLLRGDGVETEVARDGLAVEGETAAGKRARAERHHVGAAARFAEALAIAREHLEIRQQIVRPEHGLGAAQMRVAGDHGVGILRGQIEQRAHQALSSSRARSHSSRSQSRVSSETCSLRLRPVWILPASAPTRSPACG